MPADTLAGTVVFPFPGPELPHKSLHNPRFLVPRKPLMQEHVPRHDIDEEIPRCFQIQTVIAVW